MPLAYPDGRMVVDICWACSGAGYTLKTVAPITFRICWMCYGWRGKYQQR